MRSLSHIVLGALALCALAAAGTRSDETCVFGRRLALLAGSAKPNRAQVLPPPARKPAARPGGPTEISQFPNSLSGLPDFMLKFDWKLAPKGDYNFVRSGGRKFCQSYYSRVPDDPDRWAGFREGDKRVRFEGHNNGNDRRHRNMHAHFEIYRNGEWQKVGQRAWLPNEGVPLGFFDP